MWEACVCQSAPIKNSISDVAGSSVQDEVSRLSRGSAMLSAFSHASHEMASVLHEFARRIRARADVFRYAVGSAHIQ